MKQMKDKRKLTINTLAMGNLKQRRKQYTILIVGIILAMVFSSGVTFFISCLTSSLEEDQKRTFGTQEFIYTCADTIDLENSPLYEFISECGYGYNIGYAYKEKDALDNGFAVTALDETAQKLYYLIFLEGNYPEKKGEIAIEESMLIKLGLADKKVGDKITVSMLVPNHTEYFDKSEDREFVLSGIVRDRYASIGNEIGFDIRAKYIPGAYVHKDENVAVGGRKIVLAFCNTIDFEGKSKSKYTLYDKAFEASVGERETADFMEIGLYGDTWSEFSDKNQIQNGIMFSLIFTLVLMLVSCLAIVNSFSNNLRERKKQIGMLRAVGATKRQIIKIFAREALIISLISAPISLFISYFGVKMLVKIFGESFVFIPDYSVLILSVLFSVICVMCAALIPLVSASNISPMQAIRNVELSRKAKNKKIKSKMTFKVPDLLSQRSITFFRTRQIIVSIILAATIIASCFFFSIMMGDYSELHNMWYDYTVYTNAGNYNSMANYNLNTKYFSDNDRADLVSSQQFSKIYGYKNCNVNLIVDKYDDYMLFKSIAWNGGGIYESAIEGVTKENFKEKATAKLSEEYLEAQKKFGYDTLLFSMDMRGVDAVNLEAIEDSVIEGEIDIDKLNSGEEVIVYCPEEIGLYIESFGEITEIGYMNMENYDANLSDREIFETAERSFHAGDEITVSVVRAEENGKDFVRTDKKVKIGAIVDNIGFGGVFGFYYTDEFTIITSSAGMEHFAPGLGYNCFTLWGNGELNAEADEKNVKILEDVSLRVADGKYFSEYAANEKEKDDIMMFIYALIAIIILFFAICGSVINNALTARIRDGKKEIGTLRAVGADMKVIVKSYIKQLISMFGWGYGLGFGGYSLAHFVMKALEKTGIIYESEMEYQVWQVGIMSIGLFLICAVNLTLKIRKEMKHSIVENIREL